MQTSPSLFLIEDFAQMYIGSFDHHNQVREEALAEAFREYAGLSPFPTLAELVDVLYRANVDFKALPGSPSSLPGANVWAKDRRPTIYINPHLTRNYTETTIAHELREVIEQAFGRVRPSYAGLDTHDNKAMNPRSDRFARNLLMPRIETQSLLTKLGFDFVAFSERTGRSLPSVLVRAQDICSAKHGWGITGGLWLFEHPWGEARSDGVSLDSCRVGHRAHLRGFSTAKRRGPAAQLARQVFPSLKAPVGQFDVPTQAFRRRRPVIRLVRGFDLFGMQDYIVIAEPLLSQYRVPWRVFVAAIRNDFASQLNPWISRLAVAAEVDGFQSA